MLVQPGSTFYDSASHKAPTGELLAAYLNGKYAYSANDLSKYKAHFMISVTRDVTVAKDARCLDIETFDARPEDAPRFVFERLHHGHTDALLYVNRSNRGAVILRCASAGLVLGHHYWLWVATLDGTTRLHDMTGVQAIQYTDHADIWDESEVILPMQFTTS